MGPLPELSGGREHVPAVQISLLEDPAVGGVKRVTIAGFALNSALM